MTALATTTPQEIAASALAPTPRLAADALVRMLDDHSVRSVPVPKELAEAIPLVVAGLMRNESPRVRAVGVKLATAALAHNLRVVEFVDKANRLDTGKATENVAVTRTVSLDDFG